MRISYLDRQCTNAYSVSCNATHKTAEVMRVVFSFVSNYGRSSSLKLLIMAPLGQQWVIAESANQSWTIFP